jgi:hypothetical protein
MDPYLETPAFWGDFHASFITYWRYALSDSLPGDYEARLQEKVYLIESPPPSRKLVEPDIAVTQRRPVQAPSPAPDPDLWCDLGAVFATTYERSRYARSLDYAAPPPIALDPERLAWVRERAQGANRTGR